MAHFSTAPITEVATKRKQRQPPQRAQMRAEYQQALREAIEQQHALVVELEDDDKPLTIRNRLKRAAQALGNEHIIIRRRRDRIVAHEPQVDEQFERARSAGVGR